jgi:hypothetical protein
VQQPPVSGCLPAELGRGRRPAFPAGGRAGEGKREKAETALERRAAANRCGHAGHGAGREPAGASSPQGGGSLPGGGSGTGRPAGRGRSPGGTTGGFGGGGGAGVMARRRARGRFWGRGRCLETGRGAAAASGRAGLRMPLAGAPASVSFRLRGLLPDRHGGCGFSRREASRDGGRGGPDAGRSDCPSGGGARPRTGNAGGKGRRRASGAPVRACGTGRAAGTGRRARRLHSAGAVSIFAVRCRGRGPKGGSRPSPMTPPASLRGTCPFSASFKYLQNMAAGLTPARPLT